MDPIARRALGAHYTSESNILKLIRPLFLDSLRDELEACGSSKPRLRAFHAKLGRLVFFDPACGCGNFLVIAYREVRRLETEVITRLNTGDVQMTAGLSDWRRVTLDQFVGIELEEFPARIAETAMYLVDHLENEALGSQFGLNVPEFPLTASLRVTVGNALLIDWREVLPPGECSYILGNPPYAGKHLLNASQRADLDRVLGDHPQRGSLDYVTGWLVQAARYIAQNPTIHGAYVATNSITQGEQVPILWPFLHDLGLHLTFAWRTFNWTSEGRGAAHVHVVIVGFSGSSRPRSTTLYEWDERSASAVGRATTALNGYLAPGAEVYPSGRSKPLVEAVPPVIYGAKPADGGHLLLSGAEADEVHATDAVAARFIRPLLSATEFLNGQERFCFWLEDVQPSEILGSRVLRQRLEAVREFRLASSKPQTREMADMPGLFAEMRRPSSGFIFIPRHSSASRDLIPMGFIPGTIDAVVHDSGAYVETQDVALFGILQSKMFAAWQRAVGGRIKSDYRFNNRLVYNTFPFPTLSFRQTAEIEHAAHGVLAARESHGESTLAELYSHVSAPASLVAAHQQLDRVVDAAFGRRTRLIEPERLAILFAEYVSANPPKLQPMKGGRRARPAPV
jgi:hypothetical protein